MRFMSETQFGFRSRSLHLGFSDYPSVLSLNDVITERRRTHRYPHHAARLSGRTGDCEAKTLADGNAGDA
jgi:hypothetical protein